MGEEFERVVARVAEESSSVGAVVLRGAGRAFSAGGDLEFLRRRNMDSPSRNASIMRRFYERFLSVRRLPVPVVAAINGPAIGAGLCLALACDVRVAAASAKMGVTFVGLGLHPGMGATHTLPRIVGAQTAARLLLTGDVVSGEEAAALGMVAEAVSGDDDGEAAVAKATELAARMASKAPAAVRATVRTLRLGTEDGLERALWREADAQAQSYATADLVEGVSAIEQKRRPNFTQREGYAEAGVWHGPLSGRRL
ncbi:unnamed protein product [Symbiodinium sp. KB8]|nr:unnamed protein product [Symbiodinium sp. KB8]